MYYFTPDTIFQANKNIEALDPKVGGLLCVLHCLVDDIEENISYTVDGERLRKQLSLVFDKEPRDSFENAKASYIIFARNWVQTFFDTCIKNKIDLLSCAVFFLRRNGFEREYTKEEIIDIFIDRFHLVNYKEYWFYDGNKVELTYNQQNVEDNQAEFYSKMNYTTDFKSILFRNVIQKSAADLKAAGQIQTLYSGSSIHTCFLLSDESLDQYYVMSNSIHSRGNQCTIEKYTGIRNSDDENAEFRTGLDISYERNRIVFGAPGTGKSHLLKDDVKKVTDSYGGTVVERVTFHPEYSYSQFVGTYKPTMIEAEPTLHLDADKKEVLAVLRDNSLSAQEKYDLLYDRFKEEGITRLPLLLGLYCDDSFRTKKQDGTDAVGDNSVERNHGRAIRPYVILAEKSKGKSEIAYEYVPGPFMRMYVSALKSARCFVPQPHILIIEEINRAKVAAVFGDVFQLLDRDENGVSEYDIQASEDIKKYLAKELGGSPEDYSRIRIPDNMFIWSTMNSADQGVFPMDTAFKRRWNFEYLGIDKNEEKITGKGKLVIEATGEMIEWNRLRKAINAKMSSSEFKINEDKLMGPFFLSKKAIASDENGMIIDSKAFVDAFKSKVIMYLYEDAVKQGKHRFFDGCPDTSKYSAVCDAFDKIGISIFGPTFREDFYDKED